MKTLINCLVCACGLTLVPLALSAKKAKPEYQLAPYEVLEIEALPKLVKLGSPRIQTGLAGTAIDLEFTVSEKGYPKKVRTAKPLYSYGLEDDRIRDFAVQMTQLVSSARFEPALDARGQAVAVKVRMPVKIVQRAEGPRALVSLKLDAPVIDKS